ncbi:hypothetical protein PIROE2DRAFT_62502 [Piromyces sp. E2]|nr:hypothetical protein PIROE2DRAFT_62502 [Piromyces sp. E2]|eukprot:OUM61452.1 hypothetical protein PIROE2DRAFT_62502 [Piromyces sp. E2]
MDIPLPEPEFKGEENKSFNKFNVEKTTSDWDIPLDMDIPLPEPEFKEGEKNAINNSTVEKTTSDWDIPLNMDIPLPEPEFMEGEKNATNKSNVEKTTSDWDIPLNMDVPLPEPEFTEGEKNATNKSNVEKTTSDWDIPLNMDIPIPPVESMTSEANQPNSVTVNENNGWDIPVNDIPMPSIENVPLSSSPKKDSVSFNLNENIANPEMKTSEEKKSSDSKMDEVMPLPEEYIEILETIKLDRNLHILICSRGFTNQFIMSSLFQPLIQSVLTPVSLSQSKQKVNQSMISHKFSEYHNLLGYIVASLVSSGFINEAARLVYFYMNNNENDSSKEPQEIHVGLIHRYKLLKSYLKKTHSKINRRIKTQTKDHDNSNIFLRLNDQPQSIENAIIQEYMDLNQIKEKLEKAIEFIEHTLN